MKLRALSLLRAGQTEAAHELFLEEFQRAPAPAAIALSELLEANPANETLQRLLARMLENGTTQSALWRTAGRLAARNGDMPQAIHHFSRAHQLEPGDADNALLLGISLLRTGRMLEALPPLRAAYRLRPDPIATQALADAEFETDHPALAQPLLTKLLEQAPNDTRLRLRLAETHSQLGDHAQALALYRDGLLISPHDAALHMALAQAEEDAGEKDAAAAAYREALRLQPGWAMPLAGLIGLLRGQTPPDLLDAARRTLDNPQISPGERASTGYALGKALDSQKRYADAMHIWDKANAAREIQAGRFNPAQLSGHLESIERSYRPGRWKQRERAASEPRMVFIVGMPRSGTTLTERILAAHPEVHGCGELPDLPRIARELGSGWPSVAIDLPSGTLAKLATDYLQSASRHARTGTRVLVDKAPLNFFQLGLACSLFPDARVIWCRRDRRDVALSIYSENFSPASTFATRLENIAAYQDAEDRLLALWQQVLPLPILVQDYEALTREPEAGARRLLAFLGLEWNPDVLLSHRQTGGVQTPSRWQVREPVHTRSIGRWRNYPGKF
ncbi:sulfotransferase [Stenotrophomonas sp. YIM B06876]|uniref:tetratricopeptide repeat-containing sulfotransferase family protein n=1 Tax=Stenotrophomonas sp. YIM B06876 TaxID=3060211 RepID=UPI002739F813|nr:sulfotransferase [Stenotrophomonas sp. YIM B06876]